jgi:uroporphyrinogen decarboxylase
MTSRERLRTALQFKEPDKIPFDLGSRSSAIEIEAYDALKRHLGIQGPGRCFIRSHAEMEVPVLQRLGVDTQWVRAIPADSWIREDQDMIFLDRWDVPWRRKQGLPYFELDRSPLASVDLSTALEARWRLLVDDSMAGCIQAEAMRLDRDTTYSVSSDQIGAGIVERAWYLRGFENFMMDLMCEERLVHKFLRKILDHQLAGYERILGQAAPFIETVWITDDLATQENLMFSPELYRRIIKPYQKELITFIQARGVDVVFHSCGAVRPLVPDLIEIGVRILHPIQTSARDMDPVMFKRDFGRDLVFWGGGCETETLQIGSVQDVVDETKRRIDILGPGGGFIFSPTHCIQPGTPPENILAMADTLASHGWR